MITITQQLEKGTLTQHHFDMATIDEVKKVNLAHKLEVLELEMQKPLKDWTKIAFLKTEIFRLKNYLKLNK
jgi:hypothetical protein